MKFEPISKIYICLYTKYKNSELYLYLFIW